MSISNIHGRLKKGSEVGHLDMGNCYLSIYTCKNCSVVYLWFVFNYMYNYTSKIKNQVKLIHVNAERIYMNFCNFWLVTINQVSCFPPASNAGQMYRSNQLSVRDDMKIPLENLCQLCDRFYSSFSNRLVLNIHLSFLITLPTRVFCLFHKQIVFQKNVLIYTSSLIFVS